MFETSGPWEKIFYFLTYLSQGPSFLNPYAYSVLHARHHRHSDTKFDPHSPVHNPNMLVMMLRTYRIYQGILSSYLQGKEDHKISNTPTLKYLDHFAASKTNILMWVGIYIGIYYFFNIELIYYPLLLIHFFMGPLQGFIVNWFGHKIGYRNYSINDQSKNTLFIDFALMGELYQNNHHRFGKKINFAHKWFELDFTFLISKILHHLGLIRIKEDIYAK
jgi:stearoyl-CoA desaturase (delta-9 desaturase)